MSNPFVIYFSLLVFLPAIGALLLAFFPKDKPGAMKLFALAITVAVFLLNLLMLVPGSGQYEYDLAQADMQKVFNLKWIPAFNIEYLMGTDGISFPLLLLTTFSCILAMGASWNIQKHVKAYCILFLLLETGMIGVFLALDFFLFYVFWEVMLLPMYFLIGVWGGPRREYAAIKFFLYTLLGSVLMLIAILMLYYNSDIRQLTDQQLVDAHVVAAVDGKPDAAALKAIRDSKAEVHTFNILALQKLGQNPDSNANQFNKPLLFGKSVQWWAFVLLFIGFAVKVPSVPVHTWLPDAHVEAPTPISMLLAGVLLKMGGYGILRICFPICPAAGHELAGVVCGLGLLSMVYGAFAALAQKDFKRLVAYSSVSHMGYVMLGIGAWSAMGPEWNTDYWTKGVSAAMFQMIAHGISSPGMFFMVGIIYDRVHHRNLEEFGGLFAKMPTYAGIAIVIFFAGLGLPGLCGFWGEAFVTLAAWNFSKTIAVISAAVVILTAGYILWMIQRVYLGAEYKGPHGDHIHPITPRELSIAAPIVALAIFFGVYPNAVFKYITPAAEQTVKDLTAWQKSAQAAAEKPAADNKVSEAPRLDAAVPARS